MTWLLCLTLALGAELNPAIAPQLNDSRHANVVLRLYGENELRYAHAGYWAALEAVPEWKEQEAIWWELMRTPDLGPLLARADEALVRDPQAQAAYDSFHTALAANPALRESVERFERAALSPQGNDSDWLRALNFFRSNPQGALPLLGGINADAKLPEELKPYALALLNARNWDALRVPLSELADDANAQPALEWWAAAARLDAQNDGVFGKLATHLMQRPNRFWAIYRRDAALAANPHLRDWVRWWHRTARRDRSLGQSYLAYLSAIKAGQETPPGTGKNPWPPEGPPGEVAAIAEERLPAFREDRPSVMRPTVERPKSPEAAKPAEPKRPEKPGNLELRQSDRVKERRQEREVE
jgi:hypothetical protein